MDQGTLKNGNIVAVKKLVMGTSRAKADFATEVKLISNVHHRSILRLLGCSSKGPDLLLVYDYMANGSLDKFLYGKLSISSTHKSLSIFCPCIWVNICCESQLCAERQQNHGGGSSLQVLKLFCTVEW